MNYQDSHCPCLVEEVGDGWNRWMACFPPLIFSYQPPAAFFRSSAAVWIGCDGEEYEYDHERGYEYE